MTRFLGVPVFLLLTLPAVISMALAASGLSVGGAFRHTWDHAARWSCGAPLTGATWTTAWDAHERFQRCVLRAHIWRVVTPTPTPRPKPSATPRPTVPAPNPTGTPIPSNDPAQYEMALMNRDRSANGLYPYSINETQSAGTGSCAGSIGHAEAMAQSGQIWHTNPAYPAASFPNDICVPLGAVGAAENVGMSMSGSVDNDLTMIEQEMMSEPHSPGCTGNHACSILSSQYREVGIGIVESGGATWLAVDFVA